MSKQRKMSMRDKHSVVRRIRSFKFVFKVLEIMLILAKIADLIDGLFKK